jgi:heptosyltransferase-2
MKILILKLGATGDVLRTTPILHKLPKDVYWITSDENLLILKDNHRINRCVSWSKADELLGTVFDLVINLEDSFDVAKFVSRLGYKELFGAYLNDSDRVEYTESSRTWFDLSLISRFGRDKADQIKLVNRRTYQDLIFSSLGYTFENDKYLLPKTTVSSLVGDIAIANTAGPVWPMKKWAYYDELKTMLGRKGYIVNILPHRNTVLEHIADVQNHKCLISGDSLPMHIALGSGKKCVTIFQCTSPWEIHDYGLQTKIISPLLEKYFYKRHFDIEATTCISVNSVYETIIRTCSCD